MRGRILALASLIALMSFGCSGNGLLITIEADPGIQTVLGSLRIAVAGMDPSSTDGRASEAEIRCFYGEEVPLVLLLHPGQQYSEMAAIRVEAWDSTSRLFIYEELMTFDGDTRYESTINLSAACRGCEGEFCLGLDGCLGTSPTGAFGIAPDDFDSSCSP